VKFIVREKDREYEFLLSKGLYIVGRDPTCDLTLDSRRVSRRHMSCSVTDEEVRVKDLGSRNGIQVAGVQVKEAALHEGDEVQVGNAVLEFQGVVAAAPAAAAAEPVAPVQAVVAEPSVEDKESTSSEGVMVPARAEDVRPQLVQRDGRWFAKDPQSGREVEIVPAETPGAAAPAAGKSLLSTPKGKLIIGGLAAVVAVILIAALLSTGVQEAPPAMGGEQYNRLVAQALDALDAGDSETAKKHAYAAVKGRPNGKTAKLVGQLALIWDDWRKDFWEHWRDVEAILEELYELDSSPAVQEFTQAHRDRIEKERVYSQFADEARQAYQANQYEEAWRKLQLVPAGSPVRDRDAELVEGVKRDLKRQIETGMASAAARQNWTSARAYAEKLSQYYPEEGARAEGILAKYAEYEGHAHLVQQAKLAIAKNNFGEVERVLRAIPDSSPYRAEAKRLLQRAQADEKYANALALYNEGDGAGSLKALEAQDSAASRALKRHVESILALYEKAQKAQKDLELIDAEGCWQRLAEAETDDNNHYRREALGELARMEDLRLEYARQLLEGGDAARKKSEFKKARELYAKATVMDPDARMGLESLGRMEEQGRMDYRRALIEQDKSPKKAISLLERAIQMLPPDDKYYTYAVDKKREIEATLKGN